MVRSLAIIFLTLVFSFTPIICFADDWGFSPTEEFIWVSTQGSETTPYGVQDEQGGYVVIDKHGNETWIDDIDDPHCIFVATRIQSDDPYVVLDTGKIKSEIYVEGIDFSGCNYE